MQVGGGESAVGGQIGEANQSSHQGELSLVVELEPRHPLAARRDRGLDQLAQLAPIEESFQDVLPDVEIILGDGVELGP